MTKLEHNPILYQLWDGVNLNDFRDEIKKLSSAPTKDMQISLMEKLIDGFPPKHEDYQGLKAQVEKAVADSQKGRS
ncbi:MAG: hypothetical protein JJE18_01570 [Eubacteriaceae bacterium]|nr:hypothetical protein [Eubacteriaceae bacterium]